MQAESVDFNPKKVFINPDQTILERQWDNRLRAELKTRKEQEPNFRWTIFRGRVKKRSESEVTREGQAQAGAESQ